ncbi:spore cortex-lytic enzyme [Ornithinibacillus halophilus]|uniref:Spore cortex-lytic enzyme n=1 Tax=Ornithinibacillus halophilus TaxID=930117 RepID=A0A1M5CRV7_9BACI|nr:spore cortex-lytic enzyme [Ornithinibacillus halophilus]SHF57347.1 N-acetylmuramoyl-L-alanine amidase [Ornithinibacillus halophilus]
MKFKKLFLSILAVFLFSVGLVAYPTKDISAFSEQIIQHGAVGDDVIELQARLQYLGFYKGEIDGVFGWGTYWALRNFQKEFELKKVDGLAGKKTKEMLERATDYDENFVKEQIRKGNRFTHYGGMDKSKQSAPGKQNNTNKNKQQAQQEKSKQQGTQNQTNTNTDGANNEAEQQSNNETNQQANNATEQQDNDAAEGQTTKAVNVPQGFSQNDINLMANAVYGEARGEPYEGQVAVAAVILNRVESPTFPNTVSGVIFEPRAFTAVADGQIWLTPNDKAREAVLDAINGWDPTGNAIYYFNPDTATSSWIWGRPQIKRIGKHIFCK